MLGEDDVCVFIIAPPVGIVIPKGIGTSPAVVINIVTGPAGPTTTTGVPARALACHIRDACNAAVKGAGCNVVSMMFADDADTDDDGVEEEEEEEEGNGATDTVFEELDVNGVDLFSDSSAIFDGAVVDVEADVAAFAARASI